MFKKIILSSLFIFSSSVFADSNIDNFKSSVKNNWDNAMAGQTDIYVPLHTWHNRASYSTEDIKSFNENPWGFGYGKSYKDEDGNWHGFFMMAFMDSHKKVEPMVGYGYTKNWYDDSKDWSVGAGYTAFITARDDIAHYFPIPGILPLVSVGYKDFTLSGTYVPGGKGTGNVAFLWGRYSF